MTCNLGYLATSLTTRFEELNNTPKSEAINQKIQAERKKIEAIHKFLAQVDHDSNESLRIDYGTDPQKIALVDEMREVFSTDLFPVGQYEWKDKSLDRLIRSLEDKINQEINPTISQFTGQQTKLGYELNQVVEIMTQTLKRCYESIERILSNIAKA